MQWLVTHLKEIKQQLSMSQQSTRLDTFMSTPRWIMT